MVEFVLTPPFLIPVAIAAVLGAAMMKTPEKAPASDHLTVDIPKATYDALARQATADTPVRTIASRIVVNGAIR